MLKNKNIRMNCQSVSRNARDKAQESGAIMLEAIAVLSLMALMGSMLFRQIYLRNQELSNIQMASELRIVKEAFGSWIQANPQEIQGCEDGVTWCKSAVGAYDPEDVSDLRFLVGNYLPAAYDDKGIIGEYNLFLRCERLGAVGGNAGSGYRRCHGLVVPQAASLPEDWNFKRAARVAVLAGMDGGVYGEGVTDAGCPVGSGDKAVVGSMGAWEMCVPSGTIPADVKDTHVAVTGIDVFQPEMSIDTEVHVNLPHEWNFVTKDTGVYGDFAAGLVDSNNCFAIHHDEEILGTDDVRSDVVSEPGSSCQPAFYVEADDGSNPQHATGNVRVLNDLSVGYDHDAKKAAMRLDRNGVIVFEKDTVSDPQSSDAQINYLLDPKYTSVVNDVKIMSRGGARLSEILPKYILVDQQKALITVPASCAGLYSGSTTVTLTKTCPEGYKQSIVLIPYEFGSKMYDQTGARRTFYVRFDSKDSGDIIERDVTTLHIQAYYYTTAGAGYCVDYPSIERVLVQQYCVFVTDSASLPEKRRGAVSDEAVSMAKSAAECQSYGGAWNAASSTCSRSP